MKNTKYITESTHDKGCWVSLNGLYYLSLVDDNKTNPLDGTGADPKTWDGGYTKKEMHDLTSCRNPDQVIQQCLADACEKVCDNDPIMDLDDIKELCKGEKISVGDWRKHNGFLYVSCTDIESSIPFPDSRDWEGPFDALDVLNNSLKPCGSPTLPLDLPVWENCSDGDFCVTAYPIDACVWSFDDEAEKYKIFTSIKSDNQDRPFEGSKMTEPSWDGGYTICEYLNRPVSKNLNNELASPKTRNCYIGCAEINPDNLEIKKISDKLVLSVKASKGLKQTSSGIEAKIGDGLEFGSADDIKVKPSDKSITVTGSGISANIDGKSIVLGSDGLEVKTSDNSIIADADGIKVGQIGVDINGNPVNAGTCLITCEDINTDQLEFVGGKLSIKPSWLCAEIAKCIKALPTC